MTNIDKEAAKLYKEVLAAYYENPGISAGEILDTYLVKYNDAIAAELQSIIYGMMGASMTSSLAAIPLTTVALSNALYTNARETSIAATNVINDHIATSSTIGELREALYDGYGYEELLPIKAELPNYLSKTLTESKLNRLKTVPLKSAYLKVLEAKNDRDLQKAMQIAVYEKARYYASRIAITEEARAFTLSNADRALKAGVKYVKWTLSSLHKTTCVCELYANQDIGYGKGIYPILEAPAPVYSTHPFCKCVLRDYHRTPTYKEVKDPSRKALEKLSDWEQRQVLGSRAKQTAWKSGKDADTIMDSSKKGFGDKKIKDLFNDTYIASL